MTLPPVDYGVKLGYHPQNIQRWVDFYGAPRVTQFLRAAEKEPIPVIRLNTLKASIDDVITLLRHNGITVEALPSRYAYRVKRTPYPLGATTEYLAGLYYIQGLSSQWAVDALDPQPGERILDLAAAPGGKTTQIAQYQADEGVILAVDRSKRKTRALEFNLGRMGITSVAVWLADARTLPHALPPASFDRVLVDAPCSGTGVVRKDASRKRRLSLKKIQRHATLQKKLLRVAAHLVKPHGTVVYSTCSLEPEENERVVNESLTNGLFEVEPLSLTEGVPGLTEGVVKTLRRARRIFPSQLTDGFFLCRLRKTTD